MSLDEQNSKFQCTEAEPDDLGKPTTCDNEILSLDEQNSEFQHAEAEPDDLGLLDNCGLE